MPTIKTLMDMRGRRALITGAAGFLGRTIASTLAELGAELLLVDCQSADYGSLPDDLESSWGTKSTVLTCDLESQSQRQELIDAVIDDGNGLNLLVNNAAFVGTSGLPGWATNFESQSIETWRRAVEVNLTAGFHLSQGLTPALKMHSNGAIINVASIYGILGPDYGLYEGTQMGNPAAYAASKGGLIQLTRWLATTLAPHVRVNTISPGGIFRNQPDAFVARYAAKTPMARMAGEDDFCGAIAFFATDMSQYVTGQNLAVDGGWSAW